MGVQGCLRERGANARVEGKVDGMEAIHEAENHINGEVHLSGSHAKRPVEPRLESETVVMSAEL